MPAAPGRSPDPSGRTARLGAVVTLCVTLVVVTTAALYRVRGEGPYLVDPAAALAGAAATAAETGRVAAGTWLVLALLLFALGGWLRRRVPDLTAAEATAGAVVLTWGGAYVTLLALGPPGLLQPTILRVLVIVVPALTLRRSPRAAPAAGGRVAPWIACGVFALVAPPLLLLQLGSPVSPFMDILPYVASAEKIVTFQRYDPFANDAAGLWSQTRQVAGCDGLFALLALIVGSTGRVAITSLIVPMAALQLLAIYLLGRRLYGGLCGAFAGLFLVQTFLWRHTPDMRGTSLAFPLIAIGLALLLGPRTSGARAALGGASLGLAVTLNPLIGFFGMQVAAVGALIEALDFRRALVRRTLALAAGTVLAGPQLLIGLGWRVAPPVLLLLLLIALALLIWLATRGGELPARRPWTLGRLVPILALPLVVLWLHGRRGSEFFTNDWFGYPILALLAGGGLAVAASAVWREPGRWPSAALPALALLLGIADFTIASPYRFEGELATRAAAGEVIPKVIYYWTPFWLAALAGMWFAMLARRWSLVPALCLALVLVIYPVRGLSTPPQDFDGQELSLAHTWGFHLTHAARGYWGGRGDRRWVIDDHWQAIADALLAEVRAGRITYDTHILHISPSIETVEAALATGISVDLITPRYNPASLWNVDSRVRGMDAIPEAFAARPPYVVIEHHDPRQFPELADYEQMLARSYVSLYRLRGVAPAPARG